MPPKKKAKTSADKDALLKEIEERRQAIEAEKLRKEKEMEALLAEQEALKSKLAEADDSVEESEGEVVEEGGDVEATKQTEGEEREEEEKEQESNEPEMKKEEVRKRASKRQREESDEEGEVHTTTEESMSVSVAPSVDNSQPAAVHQSEQESAPESADDILSSLPASDLSVPGDKPEEDESESQVEVTKIGMVVKGEKWIPFANRLFGNLYKERETKFFIVKSANRENLELAFEHKRWVTTKVNEIRWNEAFMAHSNVLLVFSLQGSGAFQGLARIACKAGKNLAPVEWTIPPNMSPDSFTATFFIDWISKQELPFDQTSHLRNTWNRNKLVKVARDGQEVSWKTGCSLAKLFPIDGSCDYDQLIGKIKRKRSEIGPKQAVTASSRSARKRKNLNKPVRTIRGINPLGHNRNPQNQGNAKRFRGNEQGTGANAAPLGNVQPLVGGVSNLFNMN